MRGPLDELALDRHGLVTNQQIEGAFYTKAQNDERAYLDESADESPHAPMRPILGLVFAGRLQPDWLLPSFPDMFCLLQFDCRNACGQNVVADGSEQQQG